MKKYRIIGIPDEENIYFGHHTKREEWTCYAKDEKDALHQAYQHFYYFHEIMVEEIEEGK